MNSLDTRTILVTGGAGFIGSAPWTPHESFESGMGATVEWFIANRSWRDRMFSGEYRMERMGMGVAAA